MGNNNLKNTEKLSCDKNLADVKEYYGQILKSKNDLKTTACCSGDNVPVHIRKVLQQIHPEVLDRFYGCGVPLPSELTGLTVLDLGSGTGRDAFILSKFVGSTGKVIGIDMTDEQLEVANRHILYHMEKFHYQKPNVTFLKGYIEDLQSAGIESESVDIVISNCVLNLSPDKKRIFSEIFRVLKPGGELYFSDVFTQQRIPEIHREDKVIRGECLGGAMYIQDFRRILREVGCLDYRVVSQSKIDITDSYIFEKIGMIDFYSMTIRAFKLPLEDICEDYGHIAYYKGTISESPHEFILDDHHIFRTGKPELVCGNTASILENTRLKKHFDIKGNYSQHYGRFGFQNSSEQSGNCC